MPNVSRLEVITTGSRRRWTPEEKQRILAESFAVPRNVSATARRYGLSNGQLFTWRRQAREGKLVMDGDDAGFTPVIVAPERSDCEENNRPPQSISSTPADGRMEIVLPDGRRVIVGYDVDVAALARVIKVLERR
jgi:transposase